MKFAGFDTCFYEALQLDVEDLFGLVDFSQFFRFHIGFIVYESFCCFGFLDIDQSKVFDESAKLFRCADFGRKGAFHRIDTKIHYRSEEHTSELQSLMRISYAVFCLKKKKHTNRISNTRHVPKLQTLQ